MVFVTMRLTAILFFNTLSAFVSSNGQNQRIAANQTQQILTVSIGDTVSEIGKNIRCIFQDRRNNLWFATDGEGVFTYDGKTILQLTDKHGLCSNFVECIQQSNDGRMLFNTRDGVCSFDGRKFVDIKSHEYSSTSTDVSNSILLLGNYYQNNTLNKFQLPQTSHLTRTYSRDPYAVYCSFRDSKGNIWIGTESRGVCKYDGKSFTWFDNDELGLAVRCIFEDKSGNIWIGNNGYGLFRYDGKSLTNFTREHNLDDPGFRKDLKGKAGTLARVWTITEDQQGNIWIGTIDAGLWKYDGKVLTNYTVKDGLTSNSIWAIYCDNNGNLWIGSADNGLTKHDGRTFTTFAGQKQSSR